MKLKTALIFLIITSILQLFNLYFLTESYSEISMIISLVFFILVVYYIDLTDTSFVVAFAGAVVGAVAFAGAVAFDVAFVAVAGAVAGAVAFAGDVTFAAGAVTFAAGAVAGASVVANYFGVNRI